MPSHASATDIAVAMLEARVDGNSPLVQVLADKLNAGLDSHAFTISAVTAFLRTLGEENVAPRDLPAKLDAIAGLDHAAAADRGDAKARRDLSVSHNNIGGILLRQGG